MIYQRYNTETFIQKARAIHGDKYDYSLVAYINARTKIKVICPIHGIFEVRPLRHLNGQNCPLCVKQNSFSTREEFIEKAKKIHGNKYDYSFVIYISSRTKVKIICPIHGIFEQIPNSHLLGKGCIKCSKKYTLTKDEFIVKSKEIHNNKYDYSLVNEYKTTKEKVSIICPTHGIFEQSVSAHLQGQGCPKCNPSNKLTTEEFIRKAKLIHGDFYNYSLVNYKYSKNKVSIICPIHGIFYQIASNHLRGAGCPTCFKASQISRGEKDFLKYIRSIYSGSILENDRKVLGSKELDIYLPELKLALEYNGEYWHKLREERNPGYHSLKENLCKERGIKLINVSDKDWRHNKKFIKEMIRINLQKPTNNIVNDLSKV